MATIHRAGSRLKEKTSKHFLFPRTKKHSTSCVEELELEAHEKKLPPLRRFASRTLRSHGFDYVMGAIILFNMVAIIVEIDQTAIEDMDSSAHHWAAVCGWVILVIFILELIARLFAFQSAFWTDAWNIFDFIVVLVDTVVSFVGFLGEDIFPVSALRVARLAKLARVSKVLRVFPELRLLIAGLYKSMSAIFWGTVLLLLSLLVWGMMAVLFIHPLNKEIDYAETCNRCPRAYSSVMQSSLTFWQQIITGDSWGQTSVPVIEKHPVTVLFFVPMYLCTGLALLNLILGVVVSVAQKAKEVLTEEDEREELVLREEQHTHLLGLCMKMDPNGEGVISHDELHELYDNPGPFREALKRVRITKEEIDIVWSLLDTEKNQSAPYEDVVSAIYKIKGSDTHYMLAYIKLYITQVRNSIEKQMKIQYKTELDIEHELQEDLKKTETVEETLQFGAWQALAVQQTSGSDINEAGEGTLQLQSKSIFTPVTSFYNESQNVSLQRGNADTSRSIVKSIFTNDEKDTLLKQIGHRISVLTLELQDIWKEIECKADTPVSPVPAANEGSATVVQNLSDKVCMSI